MLLAAGVCLSLIAQIAEQIDYLRFMPPKTAANNRVGGRPCSLAGPGWVVFGAIKQVVGLFLAVYMIAESAGARASPTSRCTSSWRIYDDMMPALAGA